MTWVPFSSRSDLLAQAFNARPYYIAYFTKKTVVCTLIRYFLATFDTLFALYRARPKIIFLMNQPVFLPIIVFCYSKITKSHYILDSHSGLFNKKVWRTFTPIMKYIYKHCSLNIAHNDYDAQRYQAWGARSSVVGTEVYPYECYDKSLLTTENNVVVIGKFAIDEPTEEIMAAASYLRNVQFYFTGPIERAKKRMDTRKLPSNVVLTGFLPRDQFLGLVKAADVALVLVTTDNTMQMGAWEAMSCDTPVILSDWGLLRTTFPTGAIFVRNTKQSIREGVETFFKNREALKKDIIHLKKEKRALWDKEISAVEEILKFL